MRPVLTFLLPALSALTLAACGSSSSSSPATSSSQPATASTAAAGAAVIKTASNPTLHSTVLVNAQGMTLYHLSGEVGGKFICTSTACVQIWHPVTVTAAGTPSGVSSLGTVKRPDGTLQVTYNGTPLYTFAADKQPGEAKGQGLKDVGTWTAVTTAAPASETKPATTTSPSSGGSESSGSGSYGY
jgi:predicted lipoprotein with Yx(FWY)xxD motif